MNKIFMLFLFISLLSFFSATAQTPAKAVYFEVGGPGIASFNYDMRFTKSEKGIGGRIGVGFFKFGTFDFNSGNNNTYSIVFIPVGLNYLLGKDEKHYFELGAGATIVSTNDSDDKLSNTFGHLNFGYRQQSKKGGFFFRVAINPIFGKGFFIPYYGGVAFGYKF